MADFGELRVVPVRQVWPNEARNFTPWLAANIERLGEVLGLELEVVKVESDVGDFSLDLLAKDLGSGRNVIIENQFSSTNHDHLGKLMTYAAAFDTTAVVWIAEKIRDEHRQALEWLNRHTDSETHFFAVTVEVFRIDDSRPAFEFKPVVLPNEWGREARASAERGASPRGEAYRKFFQVLIDELREKHHFTGARTGQPQSWYSFSSGLAGITYGASFAHGDRARTEIYLDLPEAVENKALFDRLLLRRAEIEAKFAEPLSWERLDERKSCRIAAYRSGSIENNDQELQAIRSWMADKILRFKKVIGPVVESEIGRTT